MKLMNILLALTVAQRLGTVGGFAPPRLSTTRKRPQISLATSSNNNKNSAADFEYKEVTAFIEAMERQRLSSNRLKPEDREDIQRYLRKVVQDRPTAIPLDKIGKVLPGTTWTLRFSSDTATMGDLPADATVKLEFTTQKTLDYVLEFSKKTFGLNRLIAKSSYSIDTTKVNPGLVTFVYDEIVSDFMGFKNIGVGFFGMLKGRANYIETVFMDNRFWIERGYTPEGQEFYNVYIKQLEESGGASPGSSSPPPAPPVGGRGEDQWED